MFSKYKKFIVLIFLLSLGSPWLASSKDLLVPRSELKNTELIARGEGRFRRFGFHVYDAKFWSQKNTAKPPYALQLTYFMNIKSKKIVDASIKELKRQPQNKSLLKQWRAYLQNVIPNVKKGDVLTGINHQGKASFYLNAQYIGAVNDKAFAKAFFGIWLDKDTSAPKLRKQLLGTPAAP